MNTVFVILTVLIVIAAILLIIVVLLQNSKGGGLASNFVAGNQTLGVRQTADILEKITWGLVAFIIVAAVVASFTTRNAQNSGIDVTNQIEAATQATSPEFPGATIDLANPAEPTETPSGN